MKRPLSVAAAALVLTFAAALLLKTPPAQAQDQPQPVSQATCTFTNPTFSGKCVENVPLPKGATPGGVCQEVLSCLNSQSCTRTYCSATEIRGSWKLESAAKAH